MVSEPHNPRQARETTAPIGGKTMEHQKEVREMRLYHFCGKDFLSGIKRDGLTKGAFPIETGRGLKLCRMRQWLTEDPDPKKQSWATQRLLRYSRTDYRLTITIPDRYTGNLIRATDYVRNMPKERRMVVTDWPGSEKWRIYVGTIPPEWITDIVQMTNTTEGRAGHEEDVPDHDRLLRKGR